MAGKLDELFSVLRGLQSGQDDIRACVQQVLGEITQGGQPRRHGCGGGGEGGSYHCSAADFPALAEDELPPLEVEDAPATADQRKFPRTELGLSGKTKMTSAGTELGQSGTRCLTREEEEDRLSRAPSRMTPEDHGVALRKYCGLSLRRKLTHLAPKENGDLEENDRSVSRVLSFPVHSTHHLRRSTSFHSQSLRSLRCGTIHPDSNTRLWIDLGSMSVLLFDSIAVPYQISFGPDTGSGFWLVTNWLTLAVWTLDIVLGFFSGFYSQGKPELRLRRIFLHYIRTFFFIDLVTVACDWAGLLLSSILEGSSSADNVMVLKSLRVLKLNRLLRLASALHSGKFALIYDRIVHRARRIGLDHQLQFILNILKLMFAVLWLNHIGCCLWFSIQTNAIENWESSTNIGDFNSATHSGDWQYFLGFYWSMTSMVSGASIMSPTTVGELGFTILYVLFGMLVGSSLISSLAAMLLDLQMSNKEHMDNVKLLRQYVFQQGLPPGLSLNIESEVVARMKQEKRLGTSDVPCLHLLSPAMRSALYYTLYGRPLQGHPFFGVCHILDSSGCFTLAICDEAFDNETRLPGFQVFPIREHGDTCEGPLFVVLGELEYLAKERDRSSGNVSISTLALDQSTPSPPETAATLVTSGQWLCELASWLQWKYRGSLSACAPCEYLRLNAKVLLNIFSQFEDVRRLAWQYATSLCRAVDTDELEQLTDLPLREDLHESAVLSMTPEGRRAMSAAALSHLITTSSLRRGWRRKSYSLLQNQVERGECDLVMKGDSATRIVSTVTVRLEREVEKDGQIVRQVLAQISRSTKAEEAKCCLPGARVLAGELPRQALARIFQEKLYALTQAGLTTDRLQKVDRELELVEDARSGDLHLVVSSLTALHVCNLIRIGREGESETREVISIDPIHMQIEIGAPLEHHHEAGARIELVGEVKEKVAMTSGDGVDTKYIRTVFCGSLGSEVCLGRTLRRDRHESQDKSSSRIFDADPTMDWSALLLFRGTGTQSIARTYSQYFSAKSDDSEGILCAWMDETDYILLCQRKDGKELVVKWVGELQSSIQEALDEKHLSSSEPHECAVPSHFPEPETRSESANSI